MMSKGLELAEGYIPSDYKGFYDQGKMFYQDPNAMKDHVPEQYKGMFDMGMQAIEGAKYLKQKKDEMQLQMCEKAVDKIWD